MFSLLCLFYIIRCISPMKGPSPCLSAFLWSSSSGLFSVLPRIVGLPSTLDSTSEWESKYVSRGARLASKGIRRGTTHCCGVKNVVPYIRVGNRVFMITAKKSRPRERSHSREEVEHNRRPGDARSLEPHLFLFTPSCTPGASKACS